LFQKYKTVIVTLLISLSLSQLTFAKPRPQIEVTAEVQAKIDKAIPSVLRDKPAKKKKVLIYSNCGGFVHNSINVGKALFKTIGKSYPNIEFSFDDDPKNYTAENLAKYDAVMNLNATFISKTFEEPQRKALLDFISNGKSFIGIHAASDAGNWPEYTKMIGGNFNGHPWNAGGTWDFETKAKGHFACQCLETTFPHKDEIYRHKDVPEGLQFLVTLDPNSTTNALLGNKKYGPYIFETTYGVSWLKNYGKGRIFYSNFGHNAETYWNPGMVEHYIRGIIFVLSN